jgi:Helitron helicase-like domain at N-terminus
MAITRYCGKPDIFITMTTNPSWSEVEENVFTYDNDDNDPDDPR